MPKTEDQKIINTQMIKAQEQNNHDSKLTIFSKNNEHPETKSSGKQEPMNQNLIKNTNFINLPMPLLTTAPSPSC